MKFWSGSPPRRLLAADEMRPRWVAMPKRLGWAILAIAHQAIGRLFELAQSGDDGRASRKVPV